MDDLDRAAVALGVGAAASTLLGLAPRIPFHLVGIGALGMVVILLLAAAGIAGGLTRRRALVVAAGAGFLAAAALQLVQATVGGANTLGGDGSTVALLLAFGVGLLTVGLARPLQEGPHPSEGASNGS
jgi:hypothetical protein